MTSSFTSFLRPWAILPLFFVASSAFATGQEQRTINAGIKKINSNSSFNLNITYGTTPKLELSGDKEQFPRIELDQQGDTLSISHGGVSFGKVKVNIDITLPQLLEANFNGSGSGKVEGFSGDQFKVGVNSSGSVVLNVKYQNPTIEMRGSGSLTAALHDMKTLTLTQSSSGSSNLTGKADTVDVKLSGSGSLDASKLTANHFTAKVTGSGSISAYAKTSADISSTGSGSVQIAGSPDKQRSKSTGSGKITFQ